MAAYFAKIDEECEKVAKLVEQASQVTLPSLAGTDLKYSLKGRKGVIDDGIFTQKRGLWECALRRGLYCAYRGNNERESGCAKGWYAGAAEDMAFMFKDGRGTEGMGGKGGDSLERCLLEEKMKTLISLVEIALRKALA